MARLALLAALVAAFAMAASADVATTVKTGYQTILRSSASVGNYPYKFGQLLNRNLQPIYVPGDDGMATRDVLISNEPDYTSLQKIGGKLFLTTHFESPRPGSMYVVEVDQSKNGTLTPKSMKAVNWGPVGGLWIPCAGSVTPWGARLAGEEYEPDARPLSEAASLDQLKELYGGDWRDVEGFMKFYDLYPAQLSLKRVKDLFNPYRYGHIVSTTIVLQGAGYKVVPEKWYSLGRAAWELAYAMPDRRTVYMTDDGSNVGFFMFKADRPNDLSSGKLYAAKFTQTSGIGGGAFTIKWILLGSGQNAQLKALAEATKFSDIFATAAYNNGCPAGFTAINQDDVGPECLKLKPGMARAAAFLETRRYAAMLGATTEFSKWEGISFDARRGLLYTAMSSIREGMEDSKNRGAADARWDQGGPNHVRLQYNRCGCIYQLPVDAASTATGMRSLICGRPNPDTADQDNKCDLNRISSPDNVDYMEESDTIIIGEDTSDHLNNVMWAYDLKTRQLQRILSVPYGAEVTGTGWYPNFNGHGYLMAVVQHPFDGYEDKASEPGFSGIDGWVGAFTFPAGVTTGSKSADWADIAVSTTEAQKLTVRSSKRVTFFKKN